MRYTKQDIYDHFSCIADACPESCCTLWQIVIDEKSHARFDACDSVVAKRLHAGMEDVDGDICFRQFNRRCAMLDDDGLCFLQRNEGESFLCDTCRRYPRHMEEFEGERELSLSLSCPEAARQTILQKEPMTFLEYELDEDEDVYEDFDDLLYTKLQDARTVLFQTIKDRNLSMNEIFCRCARLTLTLQESLDENEIFEMDDILLNPWEMSREIKNFTTYDEEKRLFSKLYELEYLHDDWLQRIEATWKYVFSSEDAWNKAQRYFEKHEVYLEQILMSLTFTYFCGAVYDDMIYSKAALSVFSTRFMVYFALASFSLQKDGTDEDFIECLINAVYSYAREIEHSDSNLEMMEEWFDEGSYFYL